MCARVPLKVFNSLTEYECVYSACTGSGLFECKCKISWPKVPLDSIYICSLIFSTIQTGLKRNICYDFIFFKCKRIVKSFESQAQKWNNFISVIFNLFSVFGDNRCQERSLNVNFHYANHRHTCNWIDRIQHIAKKSPSNPTTLRKTHQHLTIFRFTIWISIIYDWR